MASIVAQNAQMLDRICSRTSWASPPPTHAVTLSPVLTPLPSLHVK